jgi:hypothetical protein
MPDLGTTVRWCPLPFTVGDGGSYSLGYSALDGFGMTTCLQNPLKVSRIVHGLGGPFPLVHCDPPISGLVGVSHGCQSPGRQVASVSPTTF